MLNRVIKGYTVIYDTIDGKIGFIAIDDHSGGYPYFTDRIDNRNVFDEINKATQLLKTARSMGTYYGADKVKQDTFRVVRYTQEFEVIDVDEDLEFFKQTLVKLTDEEIDTLRRNLK